VEHFVEQGGGKQQKVDGLFRATGDREMGHARKGKQASDIAFTDYEDRAVRAFGFAASENAARKKNGHVFGGGTFFVDDFALSEASFQAIRDEPLQLFLREIVENSNLPHFVDNRW
jgi:hypothetical protein